MQKNTASSLTARFGASGEPLADAHGSARSHDRKGVVSRESTTSHDRRPGPLGVGLTVLGALARLMPHAPNFTPVGGMSLFAGARLLGWRAYLLPLALMAVTDPLVGGYSFATPFVYASFLINVWIGSRFLRNTGNPLRIGAAIGVGSLQFFAITNFGVWLNFPTTYAHTLPGLASCYVAAIPFYGRTLAADLLYSAALFGLHAWLSRKVSVAERHKNRNALLAPDTVGVV